MASGKKRGATRWLIPLCMTIPFFALFAMVYILLPGETLIVWISGSFAFMVACIATVSCHVFRPLKPPPKAPGIPERLAQGSLDGAGPDQVPDTQATAEPPPGTVNGGAASAPLESDAATPLPAGTPTGASLEGIDIRICERCGIRLDGTSRICPECGAATGVKA